MLFLLDIEEINVLFHVKKFNMIDCRYIQYVLSELMTLKIKATMLLLATLVHPVLAQDYEINVSEQAELMPINGLGSNPYNLPDPNIVVLEPDPEYVQVDVTKLKDRITADYGNRFYLPSLKRTYLPKDIRNIKVTKSMITTGFESKDLLMSKKGKVASYMYQDSDAGDLLNMYKQRMLAFNSGIPSKKGITIEQAIKEEQTFDFLSVVINPVGANVEEILRYYNQRMSSRDAAQLQAWILSGEVTPKSIKQILEI